MKLIFYWGRVNPSMKKDRVKCFHFFNDSMTLFGTSDTIPHQATVLLEIFAAETARNSLSSISPAFYLRCGLAVNWVCAHHSFCLAYIGVDSTVSVSDWVLLNLIILGPVQFWQFSSHWFYHWSKMGWPHWGRSHIVLYVQKLMTLSRVCCHEP